MAAKGWNQNPWVWTGCGCGVVLLVFIVFILVMSGADGAAWSSGIGVQDEALERVRNDPAVVERLGEPIKLGWSLNGLQTHGDEGRADYSLPLSGPRGKGRVYIKAFSANGEWTFEELFVRIGDIRYDIVSPDKTQARLVVAIIYDQFPAWVYEKYHDMLSPEGALHHLHSRGADHVVEYAYASTNTAPGHTAIFTGVPPSQSGVGSNQVWSADRGTRSVVDDGKHAVFGLPDAFASPSVIKVESVADALRKTHGETAKIVGLSFKDRGAVLTTGRDPNLVLWYEKKLGTMTSSDYYTDALPGWVTSWVAEHPITDYFEDWTAADPERLQRLLGPDDAPGEGDYLGLGTTFPHNPITTEDPNRTFRVMPQSTDYLLDLARVAVHQLGLGEDDIPDLLVLSISSTDYSGHVFGPDSWEYVDNLVRTDIAVGKFIAELEQKTDIAVLITSDHGVAPLPEHSKHNQKDSKRIYSDVLIEQLNRAVVRVLGEGEWVGAYVAPLVYLTAAARTPEKRGVAINAMIAKLQSLPEVHAGYDVREATDWQAVALAIADTNLGDVFIVPARGSVVDEGFQRGKGTSHGSPWPYDRQVPVLFAGPGVANTSSTEPLAQNRVAATLCRLLGVTPPSQIIPLDPLPGL